MTIKLYEEIPYESLVDYDEVLDAPLIEKSNFSSDDDVHHDYKGIVLDKDSNVFKVVSGKFRDKKDFYVRLTKRGYIVRKVFEKRVYDWIENNAKSNLDAYLLFSTAFSKWKENNALDEYYIKLLNDMPALNREKIKGSPKTMGKNDMKKTTTESIDMTEASAIMYMPEDEYKVIFGNEDVPLKTIIIQPVIWDATASHVAQAFKKQMFKYPVYDIPDGEEKTAGFDTRHFDNPKLILALIEYIDKVESSTVVKNRLMELRLQEPENKFFINYLTAVDADDTTPKMLQKSVFNSLINKLREPLLSTYAWNHAKSQVGGLQTQEKQRKSEVFDFIFSHLDSPEDQLDLARTLHDVETLLKDRTNYMNPTFRVDGNREEMVADIKKTLDEKKQHLKDIQNSFEQTLINKRNKAQKEHDSTPYINIKGEIKNEISALDSVISNYLKLKGTSKATSAAYARERIANQKIYSPEQEKEIKELRAQNAKIQAQIDNHEIDPEKGQWAQQINNDYIAAIEKDANTEFRLSPEGEKIYNSRKRLDIQGEIETTKQDVDRHNALDRALKALDSKQVFYRNELLTKKEQDKDKEDSSTSSAKLAKDVTSKKKSVDFKNAYNSKSVRPNRPISKEDIGESTAVNAGASIMYNTQPIGGQPRDVFATSNGMLPVCGIFMEDEDGNQRLNDKLFADGKLLPNVKETLLKIAETFFATVKDEISSKLDKVKTILVGSNAGKNYKKTSDIDLHLVFNLKNVSDIEKSLLEEYLNMKRNVFNIRYTPSIKGLPVEVGIEYVEKPSVSADVYNIEEDIWEKQRETSNEELQDIFDLENDIEYKKRIEEIEQALHSADTNIVNNVIEDLYLLRQKGLSQMDAENSKENNIFKKIRDLGYIKQLKDKHAEIVSNELSLAEQKESSFRKELSKVVDAELNNTDDVEYSEFLEKYKRIENEMDDKTEITETRSAEKGYGGDMTARIKRYAKEPYGISLKRIEKMLWFVLHGIHPAIINPGLELYYTSPEKPNKPAVNMSFRVIDFVNSENTSELSVPSPTTKLKLNRMIVEVNTGKTPKNKVTTEMQISVAKLKELLESPINRINVRDLIDKYCRKNRVTEATQDTIDMIFNGLDDKNAKFTEFYKQASEIEEVTTMTPEQLRDLYYFVVEDKNDLMLSIKVVGGTKEPLSVTQRYGARDGSNMPFKPSIRSTLDRCLMQIFNSESTLGHLRKIKPLYVNFLGCPQPGTSKFGEAKTDGIFEKDIYQLRKILNELDIPDYFVYYPANDLAMHRSSKAARSLPDRKWRVVGVNATTPEKVTKVFVTDIAQNVSKRNNMNEMDVDEFRELIKRPENSGTENNYWYDAKVTKAQSTITANKKLSFRAGEAGEWYRATSNEVRAFFEKASQSTYRDAVGQVRDFLNEYDIFMKNGGFKDDLSSSFIEKTKELSAPVEMRIGKNRNGNATFSILLPPSTFFEPAYTERSELDIVNLNLR